MNSKLNIIVTFKSLTSDSVSVVERLISDVTNISCKNSNMGTFASLNCCL